MRHYFLLLILVFASYQGFALDIYENESVTVSFQLQKQISLVETGNSLELKFLSFTSSPDSEVLFLDEKIIDSKNKEYFPKYELDQYGNRYAVFELKNPDFNMVFIGNYKIKTKSNLALKESKLIAVSKDDFLNNSKLILIDTQNINDLAHNVKDNDFYKTIYNLDNWMFENITYEIRPTFVSGQAYSSEEMFLNKKGFCVEYANLAAAVLRNLGIPTRLAVGMVYTNKTWGMHAWLEVKDSQGNWVGYDPTYHELGYLDSTHIKQGTFLDYSQVKDLIKADFSLSSFDLILSYNPLDVNVILDDASRINTTIEVHVPKLVHSEQDFNICIFDKENKFLVFPFKLELHSDFNNNLIDKLIYLDKNICFGYKAPNANAQTEYTYNIFYLDKNIVDTILIINNLAKISVNSVIPTIKGKNLTVNIELTSPGSNKLSIVSSNGNSKEFDLISGLNEIVYTVNNIDENVINLKLMTQNTVLQELTINLNTSNTREKNNFIYLFFAGFVVVLILVIILAVKLFFNN